MDFYLLRRNLLSQTSRTLANCGASYGRETFQEKGWLRFRHKRVKLLMFSMFIARLLGFISERTDLQGEWALLTRCTNASRASRSWLRLTVRCSVALQSQRSPEGHPIPLQMQSRLLLGMAFPVKNCDARALEHIQAHSQTN